jgi:micrococcal nuclease
MLPKNTLKFLLFLSLFLNLILLFNRYVREEQISQETDSILQDNKIDEEVASPTQEVKSMNSNVYKVTRVVDGDTVRLDNGEVARYIGIDTPETTGSDECFAEQATRKNEELVLNKEVIVEKDISETDRYGRRLFYVWQDEDGRKGLFVNEVLVREGYALASTYPPDVKYSQVFAEAQNEARDENLGLWGSCKSSDNAASANTGGTITQGDWDCSGNIYNCSDFSSQAEAQSAFEACGGKTNDVHKLDADADGVVCEGL